MMGFSRKIDGILGIVAAVVFLIFAITQADRPEYSLAFLFLALLAVAGGLEKSGHCRMSIPKSHFPYRVDGVIGLIGAAALLVLGIALPTRRFIFIFSSFFVVEFALRRLGFLRGRLRHEA